MQRKLRITSAGDEIVGREWKWQRRSWAEEGYLKKRGVVAGSLLRNTITPSPSLRGVDDKRDQDSVRRLSMYVSIVIRGRGILIRTLGRRDAEFDLCDTSKVAQTACDDASVG